MPGIDGITFLRYLKEKYPNTQFIILTGHRNFEYACDALNLGAAVFLLKPVNYKELENHLKKINKYNYSPHKSNSKLKISKTIF